MSSFRIAPGVYTKEIDLSNLVPNFSTTIGSIVGASARGAVERKLITSGRAFIEEYGKPVAGNYFHYSALAFLEQGNQLYCRRVTSSTGNKALYGGVSIQKDAGAGTNMVLDAGSEATDWTTLNGTGTYTDNLFFIIGKDPGAWNNDISVKVEEQVPVQDATWFDITVYYTEKGITRQVEKWTVSRKEQVDGNGNQMYLETKINGFSKYILVADNIAEVNTVMPDEQITALALDKGAAGDTAGDADYVTGWTEFENPNDIDIRILINAGLIGITVQTKMKTIVEARKDCIAVLDIPLASQTDVAAMVTWRTTTQNFDSNYTALYGPWVKVFDEYNGGVKTVPVSGYVAAAYAYNDYVGQVWTAPAGPNRGLLNVIGTNLALTQGDIESLSAAKINPIVNFRGRGIQIWNDLTQQTKTSALSLVSVRRLMITIEKAIATSLQDFVFEPNDAALRLRVTALLEEYLSTLGADGAFQTEGGDRGYRVVCNEVNNTPATIDRQELHCDIFIKPIRPAKFIELTAVITTTGSSFEELITGGTLL